MKQPIKKCKLCGRKKVKNDLFCERCLSKRDKTLEARIKIIVEKNKQTLIKSMEENKNGKNKRL